MSRIDDIGQLIAAAVGQDDRPIVVFSAIWPFLRALGTTDPATTDRLINLLIEISGRRTLLMPAYAGGYVNGVCNLDTDPSSTGVLSECFRRRHGTRRTLSAFFSFAVRGPEADHVVNLRPHDAWGDGSLYEWMEQRDACFLMFGTHPTQCSYLHRAEWLARDVIQYRYEKAFRGEVIHEGRRIPLEERLYVRRLEPMVDNDFTVLMAPLQRAGMQVTAAGGASIARYYAQPSLTETLTDLQRDPLMLVKNRDSFVE